MQGNILITVLIVLAVLSISTLYSARESLWAMNMSHMERDALQLELFMNEALVEVEKLIDDLPIDIIPVALSQCSVTPCVLSAQEANLFLEQAPALWQNPDNKLPVKLNLSSSTAQAWMIIEHLVNQVFEDALEDYFRTSLLLQTSNDQIQLRRQMTWKRTTLKGDIIQTKSLARLAWR